MATSIEDWPFRQEINGKVAPRGITILNTAQLLGVSGITKDKERMSATYYVPPFVLTVSERIDIYRLCSPVFGVVTGRMRRISGLEWKVIKNQKEEDRTVEGLKKCRDLYVEYTDDPSARGLGIKVRALVEIFRRLPDVRRDLKNFDAALLRWSRGMKIGGENKCTEIEDWLRRPNQEDTYEDLTKKIVFDMHVHGSAVPFKQALAERIENVYELPGGTIFPVKGRFVGDATGYVQLVDGYDPQIFFRDEVSYLQYAPRSDDAYGAVPLEALVNKVAESLMFDQRAAEMADGTKPPEKLIAFGDRSPLGNLGEEFEFPLNKDEQKRIETIVTEARKEAVRVISGYGTPAIVDISRADTFQYQSDRQKMVREEVGLVFGASNDEMNLTGSDSTSGRSSSEAQERMNQSRGVYPIVQSLENFWNLDVLPFRFGSGYSLKYEATTSEAEQIELLTKKKNSGLLSVNEIRTVDMGREPLKGDQYNEPAPAPDPGSSPSSPMFTQGL